MSTPSPPSSPDSAIHVMLIDDSSVVRGLLTRVLEEDGSIKVIGTAQNGQIGIDLLTRRTISPDIIMLDIEMPVMDGITALPQILKAAPYAKVIMCSTLSLKGAEVTMKALSMGAADAIAKPTAAGNILDSNSNFKQSLVNLIKQIGQATSRRLQSARPAAPITPVQGSARPNPATAAPILRFGKGDKITLRDLKTAYNGKPSIVAIGSSTGGPPALFEVLKHCKGIDVPIVITQHMPPTFTAMLAAHIASHTGLPAQEGAEGMVIRPGEVYVAPGGHHMTIQTENGKPTIRLNTDPPENFCRPAVDPMFRSLIDIYGNKILGVILTGMGSDGYLSCQKLIESGARLFAQDEATSVVWGMPGSVAMGGLCHAILPLNEMGPTIFRTVMMR